MTSSIRFAAVLAAVLALLAGPASAQADPRAATDLRSQVRCSDADPQQGLADLSWRPSEQAGSEQRVDVTTRRDGFDTGAFDSRGPLPPTQDALTWDRVDGQALHYWRVRTVHAEGTVASAVATFEGPTCAVDEQPGDQGRPTLVRVAGADRVATAAALSRTSFTSAAAVVLARGDQYADALAGAPLAAAVGGPLLLTGRDRLSAAAADEIRRLGAATAYLLGGEAALSPQVEADLRAAGAREIRRLAGRDRFETAARVADQLVAAHSSMQAYIVEGASADPARGWPDAVTASGLAAFQRRPVLLVTWNGLPPATAAALEALRTTTATIVGGTAAVSDAVASAIADPDGDGAADRRVERIAGRTRYETSVAAAEQAIAHGAGPDASWLVTGRSYPDALAAASSVGALRGVLLLVDGVSLDGSPSARSWLLDHRADFDVIRLVGGTGAISAEVEQEVRELTGA